MKCRSAAPFTMLLACLLCTAAAIADEPHLLLGVWHVDVAKLTTPAPPKSVTITLTEAGDGRYRMNVDIIGHDGWESHATGIFKPDGTPFPAVGSSDVDIVSMTMPSRKILVMGAGIAGQPSYTRVYSLSDDGQHMIETVVGQGKDGRPFTRVNTWNRQ